MESFLTYLSFVLVIVARYGYLYLVYKYLTKRIDKQGITLDSIKNPAGSDDHLAHHAAWVFEFLAIKIPIFTGLYFVVDFIAVMISGFIVSYFV